MQEQKIYRFFIKLLKYSLVGVSLFFVLVFSLLVVITKMYNEELKEMAFNQINANLNTQFIAENIEVSVTDQFPNISITFSSVFIEDPIVKKDTLLFSEKLYLNFNAIDLLKRNYSINSISLDKGLFNLNVDKNGTENYLILKETDSLDNDQFSFALDRVLLSDFNINYSNVLSKQHYSFSSQKLLFSGDFTEKKYQMNIQSKMIIESFKAQGIEYVKNKSSELNLDLLVNNDSSTVAINHGDLSIADMNFNVVGNYSNDNKQDLNLLINGNNIQLSQVFSVFPIDYLSILEKYSSRGELAFSANINGSLGVNKPLRFKSTFNVKDGSFIALGNDIALERLNMSGKFDNQKGKLELNHFSGNIGEEEVKGFFTIEQFNRPLVSCNIKGGADLEKLSKFFPDLVLTIKGKAKFFFIADVEFDQNKTSIKKISGELASNDTELNIDDLSLAFSDLKLKTNNNNLLIKDFKGQLENGSFKGDIILYDWINSLLGFGNELKLNANFNFDELDLNSFIEKASFSNDSSKTKWKYNLTSKIIVKNVIYRNFKAKNVDSEWKINSDNIACKKAIFNAQGGRYELTGNFNSRSNNLKIYGSLNQVKVDKLFENFSNFNQGFITNNQIKGNTNLTFNLEAPLLQNNEIDVLKMKIKSSVLFKGELINHPFLKELLDYFNENSITKSIVDYSYFSKKIKRVVFEEISSDIIVKNGKVYMPKTQINNSVLNVNVSGWQSFNDSIDYHLNFNWRELRRKNEKEGEFGEVKDDGLGKQLFLNIKGTIDNPVYKLDQAQKKESRKEKVNQEKEQIKKIIKGEDVSEKDTVSSKPKFEVTWDEEDTTANSDAEKIKEAPQQKKKKDSTKINKWLKKLGVEEKEKKTPVFEIEN